MISILVWFLTQTEEKKKAKKEESDEFYRQNRSHFFLFSLTLSEFIILSYTTIHINCFLSLYSLKSRAGETFFYYYYSAKTTIKRVAVKRSVQRETVLFNTKRERERKERELKESLKIAQKALTDCANYLSIEIQIFLAREKNY